jgi:hypothetical protein
MFVIVALLLVFLMGFGMCSTVGFWWNVAA